MASKIVLLVYQYHTGIPKLEKIGKKKKNKWKVNENSVMCTPIFHCDLKIEIDM